MESQERFLVVMVVVPDEELGSRIAWQVVRDGLAACVNRLKINSTYMWKDDIVNEDEELLLIKTTLDSFERLKEKVVEMHTYEVPEVIALPIITGYMPYLDWVSESVTKEG